MEIDWGKPFGLFTRGNVRFEFYTYIAGSGANIQSLYVGDGGLSLRAIRTTFLDSKVKMQTDNNIIFEGTLRDLALAELAERFPAYQSAMAEREKENNKRLNDLMSQVENLADQLTAAKLKLEQNEKVNPE